MIDIMRFLLPSAHLAVVEENEKAKIRGHWNIECDCPSNTIFSHIHEVLKSIEENIEDFDFQIEKKGDADVCEDDIYPVGCISDITPYTIKIFTNSFETPLDDRNLSPVWVNPFSVDNYCSTDEYYLKTTSNSINIRSRTERGLFYGLKTFEQILHLTNYSLPSLEIKDAPKLALRVIHLDLKFIRPPLEYLKKLIQTLAYYKINAVLIEWEDKFPFTGDFEFIRHPGALSEKEKDDLLETCLHYYIEAIPLIQSLGHTDYILKHPNLRHLREVPKIQSGTYEMFCPTHPDTLSTIWRIQEQIMSGMGAHKRSKFIHLGLDECYYLGQCGSCNAFFKNASKTESDLIVKWINAFAEKYVEMGKKPIIWHDMLVRHPEAIEKLNKKIIICDWEYDHPVPRDIKFDRLLPKEMDPTGQTVNFIRAWAIITQEVFDEKKPSNWQMFFDSCWKANEGKYRFNSFPYTKYFKSKGFEVITAPSSQSSRVAPAGALYEIHFPNILHFNRKAIELQCAGSICTNWVVRKAIFPLVLHEFLLHAETCWSGKKWEESEFEEAFWVNFYRLVPSEQSLSILRGLNGFFAFSTRYGRKLEDLVEWARRNSEDPQELVSIERYKPVLYKLDLLVKYNQDHYDFVNIYYEYLLFISQLIHVIIEVENFLFSVDEKENILDADVQRFFSLKESLEKEKKVWDPLRVELKHLYNSVINPFEIKDYEHVFIAPISEFFDQILTKNIQSESDLRHLVDDYMNYKIKMSKF